MQGSPARRPPPALPEASNARRGRYNFAVQQPQQQQQWDRQPSDEDEPPEPPKTMAPEPPETMALRAEEAVLAAQLAQMQSQVYTSPAAIYQPPAVAAQRSQAPHRPGSGRPVVEPAPLAQQRAVSARTRDRSETVDTDAILCTSYFLLTAVALILKSKAAVVAFQLLCLAGVLAMFLLYAQVVPSTEAVRSALWCARFTANFD